MNSLVPQITNHFDTIKGNNMTSRDSSNSSLDLERVDLINVDSYLKTLTNSAKDSMISSDSSFEDINLKIKDKLISYFPKDHKEKVKFEKTKEAIKNQKNQ